MDPLIIISVSTLFFLTVLLLYSLHLLELLFSWSRKSRTTQSPGGGGNNQQQHKQLPPGSSGWPFLGEGIEFYRSGLAGFPEKFFFDRYRKYSSEVFKTSLLGETVIVIGGTASGNKFLFLNEGKLLKASWPPSVRKLLPINDSGSHEQNHKAIRTTFPNYLNVEALRSYIGTMDSMTQRHFETHWDKRMGTDEVLIVHPSVLKYSFAVACRLFLCMDVEQEARQVGELLHLFVVLTNGILSIPIDIPGTPFNRAVKASNLINKKIVTMIKRRKLYLLSHEKTVTKDMLSLMIKFSNEDNGRFMEEKFIAYSIMALIVASHETTSSVLTLVMRYLADYPEVYNKLLDEQLEIAKSKGKEEPLTWEDIQKMKYSWNVVCEVMRLAPPALGGFKQASTDFMYAGYHIPKGCKLYWSSIATHKNPEYFPEPEKFDPSRFQGDGPAPFTFVPFAGGPGTCAGKEFARVQILIFIHRVVTRYEWEKSTGLNGKDDEKLIFNPFPSLTKGLPIRIRAQSRGY
ncbi:hypothetical protein MKW94_013234 [Papaver nudicaule]|uniref:Cytochrome P450 n=1 Tax=Papaver nudicaule TaxID=74823 RepID=A0AA41VY25_PAPNU|nr:hypothetical protein [Papaver nudicaule]